MKEIVVDNFAGGGGASTGIEIAIGRSVDIAINHDPAAIAMHKANHPLTKHYAEDVWEVDPISACDGRPVALAWFSPDCKHFSKAKGGKPVEKKIRGLSWVILRWAMEVRPRVMMMENVEEIQTWGPLQTKAGKTIPDPKHTGETFQSFVGMLTTGVSSDCPALNEACEFLKIDRNGDQARRLIHGLGYSVEFKMLRACDYGAPTIRKRFFMIARCDGKPIVWPEPTHGDPNSEEVKNGEKLPWVPVSDVLDFSIPCPSIFASSEEIMEQYGIRAVRPLAEATMKRIAKGIQKFVIENPHPFIVQVNHKGDSFRGQDIDEPLDTITAKHGTGVVEPIIAPVEVRNNYGSYGNDVREPLRTITTGGHHMLVAPNLIQYHSEQTEDVRGQEVDKPLMTVDASNRYGLVSTFISQFNNNCVGQEVTRPLNTMTACTNHFGEVCAFLVKYYGNGDNAVSCEQPAPTITAKDRMGLVTVSGQDYQIVDIGLRMLTPRELFDAQGFPSDYIIDVDADGKAYPKTEQVARCGNAVCPPIPAALVRANLPELCPDNQLAA